MTNRHLGAGTVPQWKGTHFVIDKVSYITYKKTYRTLCTILQASGDPQVTEKISTAEARSQFAEVINQVAYRGVRIVLTKHDKEVAAVIPIADLEKLALLEQSLDLQEAKDSLREAHESGALISLAELKAKLIKVK